MLPHCCQLKAHLQGDDIGRVDCQRRLECKPSSRPVLQLGSLQRAYDHSAGRNDRNNVETPDCRQALVVRSTRKGPYQDAHAIPQYDVTRIQQCCLCIQLQRIKGCSTLQRVIISIHVTLHS